MAPVLEVPLDLVPLQEGINGRASNYRGVHLTSVISKIVGRVISNIPGGYLEASDTYGETQRAFRASHSCRDVLALVTSKWILELHARNEVGMFLLDISGTFDRVSNEFPLAKLKFSGVQEDRLTFLES